MTSKIYESREFVGGPWDGINVIVSLGRYILPVPRLDGMITLPPEQWMCYEAKDDNKLHFVAITSEPSWPLPHHVHRPSSR